MPRASNRDKDHSNFSFDDDRGAPSREATSLEILAVSKNLQAGRKPDHPLGRKEAKEELGIQ